MAAWEYSKVDSEVLQGNPILYYFRFAELTSPLYSAVQYLDSPRILPDTVMSMDFFPQMSTIVLSHPVLSASLGNTIVEAVAPP